MRTAGFLLDRPNSHYYSKRTYGYSIYCNWSIARSLNWLKTYVLLTLRVLMSSGADVLFAEFEINAAWNQICNQRNMRRYTVKQQTSRNCPIPFVRSLGIHLYQTLFPWSIPKLQPSSDGFCAWNVWRNRKVVKIAVRDKCTSCQRIWYAGMFTTDKIFCARDVTTKALANLCWMLYHPQFIWIKDSAKYTGKPRGW